MASQDTDRTPIPELTAADPGEHAGLYRRRAFPFVTEGTVYGFGLREYLVEPAIPAGESAVSALVSLDVGITFGLTTGDRAHLFYFHPGFGVTHVAALSEGSATGGALLDVGGNRILGGWWGPEGGGLFRHDATAEAGQGMEQFRGARGRVEYLPLPQGEQGVMALAGPTDDGTVFGLTSTGALVALKSGAEVAEVVARIEKPAATICLPSDGSLLGAYTEGRLWRYSPHSSELEALEAYAPCQRGKRYAAGVQSLIVVQDGTVYGGTSTDGYLFSYSPWTGDVVNLGKPNRQSHIRALVEGHDGRIYGVVEEPEGMAHLFRYDPSGGGFRDLGVVESAFPEYWIAHSLGSMCVGRNGELFIGETDTLSHLFIYYPPVGQHGSSPHD